MGIRDGWLGRILRGPGSGPVADLPALRQFLSEQASFIAQKVVTEYCQAKAGRYWTQLSMEQSFIDGLAQARWEAFSLVLADLFVISDAHFRRNTPEGASGHWPVLVALYAEALAAYPLPPHRPQGWGDRVQALADRLRLSQEAPPAAAREIAEVGGRAVFHVLPIHLNMRRLDGPMVVNGIAFQIAAFAGRMRTRLDRPALLAAAAANSRAA
ncbi:hypothetical protein STHU_03430 [Allostella humosa]|uniref:hypothetical protein n=1 Tax=Stella humosa TaxID=94 RepID=UPI001134542D|nr:hypothetical protein [Stella humosa]BBK29709.1 hypothetical protein STHU_03430 [Stella humosa]